MRWTSLPIRGRLTVAFAAAVAAVIGGLGVFVYLRAGSDLLNTIDAGLSLPSRPDNGRCEPAALGGFDSGHPPARA